MRKRIKDTCEAAIVIKEHLHDVSTQLIIGCSGIFQRRGISKGFFDVIWHSFPKNVKPYYRILDDILIDAISNMSVETVINDANITIKAELTPPIGTHIKRNKMSKTLVRIATTYPDGNYYFGILNYTQIRRIYFALKNSPYGGHITTEIKKLPYADKLLTNTIYQDIKLKHSKTKLKFGIKKE